LLLVHFGLLQPVVFRKSTELGKNLFEKLQAGTVIRNIKKEKRPKGVKLCCLFLIILSETTGPIQATLGRIVL
jgi:hypothetical protein